VTLPETGNALLVGNVGDWLQNFDEEILRVRRPTTNRPLPASAGSTKSVAIKTQRSSSATTPG